MKKIIIFYIVLFIPVFASAQSAVTIDTALKQSSAYLNGRLQKGTKVVVLNFTSDWPKLSDYIIEELIGYIVNDGTLTVVDRANLETVRKELNFQLSGEVNDKTAQQIGKMLGAQTIVSGGITAIGSTYRLRVRAISVQTAEVLGMQNVDVVHDSRVAALTGTASAGTVAVSAPQTESKLVNTPVNAKPVIGTVSPYTKWEIFKGADNNNIANNIIVKYKAESENIDGQPKDVLTMEIAFPSGTGGKYAHILTSEQAIIQNLQKANGIRFKVLGDGKTGWAIEVNTSKGIDEYAAYYALFTTRKNKVVEIDIPYSKFKQGDWEKNKTPFNKEKIFVIKIDRSGDISGSSTIKIFDFEIY